MLQSCNDLFYLLQAAASMDVDGDKPADQPDPQPADPVVEQPPTDQ